jgi:hypothetical protein
MYTNGMSTDSAAPYPYTCHFYQVLVRRYNNVTNDMMTESRNMKIWLIANLIDYKCYSNGLLLEAVSFKYPEDLAAFKLKFGI